MTGGAAVAGWMHAVDISLLHEDLGAGRTTFKPGVAAAPGVSSVASSPSLTLSNDNRRQSGSIAFRINRLHPYRLLSASALMSIEFDEYLAAEDTVTLVE